MGLTVPVYVFVFSLLGAARGQQNCGLRPPDDGNAIGKRIMGGVESTPYSWPFVCSLEDRTLGNHICTGTVVQGTYGAYLLTSGFCASDVQDKHRYGVWCSVHNIQGGDPRAVIYDVEQILPHHDFSLNGLSNDIALLRLSNVTADPTLIPSVCLPQEDISGSERATVMGWGQTSSGASSPVLRELETVILPNAECADQFSSLPGYFLPGHMICTHDFQEHSGVCAQDGGAPLLVEKNGRYELTGVVSWGYECDQGMNKPDAYTNVFAFKSWIDSAIGGVA